MAGPALWLPQGSGLGEVVMEGEWEGSQGTSPHPPPMPQALEVLLGGRKLLLAWPSLASWTVEFSPTFCLYIPRASSISPLRTPSNPPIVPPPHVTRPCIKFPLLKDLSVWTQVNPPLWETKEHQARWSQGPLVTPAAELPTEEMVCLISTPPPNPPKLENSTGGPVRQEAKTLLELLVLDTWRK